MRLIDADVLLEHIEGLLTEQIYRDGTGYYIRPSSEYREDVINIIAESPTVNSADDGK